MPTPPATPDAPGTARQTDSPEPAAPLPLYHRPFFWVLVGILAGMIPLLYLYTVYGLHKEPEPPAAGVAGIGPDELLEMQRAHNKGLEEEILRLQGALKEDPCTLPAVLGLTPDKAPTAPGYSPLPETPNPLQKKQPPTTPEAAAPRLPTDNATIIPVAPAPATVGNLMDQATVFILSSLDGQIGMGSGFFVAPGVIATNRHVAQGKKAEIYVGNKILGGMHEAQLIAFSNDETRDYALLRIAPTLASRAPVLQIKEEIKRTDRVSAWGFPGYITEIDPKLAALIKGDDTSVPDVVYSEGVVSVVLQRKPPVVLHTAAISQGNSGGPLVNSQGEVVGINTFIKAADKSYAQANIALPGKDLALFMQEHGIAASLSAK